MHRLICDKTGICSPRRSPSKRVISNDHLRWENWKFKDSRKTRELLPDAPIYLVLFHHLCFLDALAVPLEIDFCFALLFSTAVVSHIRVVYSDNNGDLRYYTLWWDYNPALTVSVTLSGLSSAFTPSSCHLQAAKMSGVSRRNPIGGLDVDQSEQYFHDSMVPIPSRIKEWCLAVQIWAARVNVVSPEQHFHHPLMTVLASLH